MAFPFIRVNPSQPSIKVVNRVQLIHSEQFSGKNIYTSQRIELNIE